MDERDPQYWPRQLQEIFAAVGEAMGEKRLTPDTLKSVRLPDDQFTISHVRGAEINRRKGYYLITMVGGRWTFASGHLERLSRAAAKVVSQNVPLPKSAQPALETPKGWLARWPNQRSILTTWQRMWRRSGSGE